MTRKIPGLLFCFLLSSSAFAEEKTIAITGARILPVDGAPIAEGVLVIQGGRILAVGPAGATAIPPAATVLEMRGRTILPGLVDTHSHIGLYPRPAVEANSDGNELTGPAQGIVRAVDAIWPGDPGIRMALAGGITTANIMPGSGNVIGGQTAYVKLRGATVEEMLIQPRAAPPGGDRPVPGGLKMANGENPKRVYGGRGESPSTRMAVSAVQRASFAKARDYSEKIERARAARAAGKEKDLPERDLGLEPLSEVLRGERIVHFHTHRADDILSALRLGREFGFTPVLHHVTEGYRVAGEIARSGAPCSIIVLDSPGGKHEAANFTLQNGAILEKAGVKIAFHTDDPVTSSRFLLRSAALAVREGMSEEGALRALTIHGAQMLGLAERIGSLAPGKDADLAILSGDPFSVYTQILETWIDGVRVFDRSRPDDLRHATGGFALGARAPGILPPPPPGPDFGPRPSRSAAVPPRAAPADESRGVLVLGDWVFPVDGEPIRDGAVLVSGGPGKGGPGGGKILRVGTRAAVAAPDGVPVYRARAVTPGFIDVHSLAGVSGLFNVPADQDQDETTEPNQASLRALDSFNPAEPLLAYLLAQGITVMQASPGREAPIAGQAGIFRTVGESAEAMTIRFPSALIFNLGEEPKKTFAARKKAPTTRMGTAAVIRAALNEARNHAAKRSRAAADPTKDLPDRDLRAEALALALDRKIPAVFSARREDDIETALRLAEEFQLRAVLDLATEGYLMADRLASLKVPVMAAPTMERIGSLESLNASLENGARLARAGVLVAIQSGYEDYVPKTRVVRFEAAMAAANGLGFTGALRAITLDAARILAIEDRFGSLAPGKEADLVLFDGDPFEHTVRVERVIVAGRTAFQRD